MILRRIHVEHWRCIRELELGDLPGGIIVLHGPNGTGKSSLVSALRCCLFDADHDATGKEIKNCLPWNGNGPPKVVVEFATGGATYRLTKVFSKKKEGMACLEKQAGAAWKIEHDAPKEASRRARELLGADKSTAGLNQLLWLEQGDSALPQKGLDGSLQAKLVAVLGIMVTGRDLDFQQELDKRYEKWFTRQTGKPSKGCALVKWEGLRQERLKTRDEEKKKWELCEDAIRRLQAAEDELPTRKRRVEQAQEEVDKLALEQEQSKDRMRKYNEVKKAHHQADEHFRQAEESLGKYRDAQSRCAEQERRAQGTRNAVEIAEREQDAAGREHDEELRLLEAARQEEARHRESRDDLDDCRKLWTLAQQQSQLDKLLETVRKHEAEIAELETHLRTATAPDEKTVGALRANRLSAASLKAQLQAAALTVAVTLEHPGPVRLALDGQPAVPIDLAANQPQTWSLRQRANIALPEIGTIEVARSHQNLDLEQTAHDLARLDREYDETVRSFQENPADELCLDRLLKNQLERETKTRRLNEARKELQRVAPEGRGALEAQRANFANQRRIILERRLDLASWEPALAELDERDRQFKQRATDLEAARKQREVAEATAATKLQRCKAALQNKEIELARAEESAKANREELERLGNEAALRATVEQAKLALAAAEQTVAQSELTEAEKTIDQRLLEADTAFQERSNRLRELEDQLKELGGFLQGNEGLHIRLADAEAALQDAETALAREKLEADAHKRLRDLFAASRDNQVQLVMGPIAGRVLEWARQIGLKDYQEVRFGDRFLPEGIIREAGSSDQPVSLDDESYGTAEQLSLLVRLALGGLLARDEPVSAILDDPLAHADPAKHRNILNILRIAAEGGAASEPAAGPMQILILTCHPDRFDHLHGARHINLQQMIRG